MAGQFTRYGREIRDDFACILLGVFRTIRRRRRVLLGYLVILGCLALVAHRWDYSLGNRLTAHRGTHPRLSRLSKQWRTWGTFHYTLAVSAAVWTLGAACRRRRWRVAAIACLLGAGLSGLTVTTIRWATGRARPDSVYPDGFYGPSLDSARQSFPSGHAGCTSGAAAALAASMPVLGVPAALGSGAVIWASVYRARHYLSDCVAGAGVGLYFGLLIGRAARRRIREDGGNGRGP